MKILLISDIVIEHIYSATIAERFNDVDCIISCGDLPNYYLEFIVSMLNKPLFYVMGNHNNSSIYAEDGKTSGYPEGCINLNDKIIVFKNVILMGLEGSMKYSGGAFQYTEMQMAWKINRLKPRLLLNKLFKKKYLDILVTHAPPYKIHDAEDLCHRGFKCFNKFIDKYMPRFLLHGHIHLYGNSKVWATDAGNVKVINAYGFRILEI
jgi:uncharacterized protein